MKEQKNSEKKSSRRFWKRLKKSEAKPEKTFSKFQADAAVLFIGIVSLILIMISILGYVDTVKFDVWIRDSEDFLTQARFNVCSLVVLLIVVPAFVTVLVPTITLWAYPDKEDRAVRIRRKFKPLLGNFIYIEMSGTPSKMFVHKDMVNKKWGKVHINPVGGAKYYVDEEKDLLILQTDEFEFEENKHLKKLLGDEKIRRKYWERMATKGKVFESEVDKEDVGKDNSDVG